MFSSSSTMIGSVLRIKELDFKWAQTQIRDQLLYFFFSFGKGKYFMNRERSVLCASELDHVIGMEVGAGEGPSVCVGMEVDGSLRGGGAQIQRQSVLRYLLLILEASVPRQQIRTGFRAVMS